jgi:hypothetical protein
MGDAAERIAGDVIDNVCDVGVDAKASTSHEVLNLSPTGDSRVAEVSRGTLPPSTGKETEDLSAAVSWTEAVGNIPGSKAYSRVTGATSDLSDDLVDRMGGHAFADVMLKAVNFSDH